MKDIRDIKRHVLKIVFDFNKLLGYEFTESINFEKIIIIYYSNFEELYKKIRLEEGLTLTDSLFEKSKEFPLIYSNKIFIFIKDELEVFYNHEFYYKLFTAFEYIHFKTIQSKIHFMATVMLYFKNSNFFKPRRSAHFKYIRKHRFNK